jgi:hypothetical protein
VLGPKQKTWRSEPYRRYVASQACFGCGIEGYSQCAHPNEGKGLGLKTGDDLSFPLCGPRPGHQGCHAIFDLRLDGLSRDEQRLTERGYTLRMRAQALREGWTFGRGKGRAAPAVELPTVIDGRETARSDEQEEWT